MANKKTIKKKSTKKKGFFSKKDAEPEIEALEVIVPEIETPEEVISEVETPEEVIPEVVVEEVEVKVKTIRDFSKEEKAKLSKKELRIFQRTGILKK